MNDRSETAPTESELSVTYNVWTEYDIAATWCARRNIKGQVGDPLPDLLSSACHKEINADPDAFAERVKLTAYALAMEQHAPPDPWCELCQGPPCTYCHDCGRALDEFGHCTCWKWLDR
jgi:hypothetical protein